MKNPGMLRVSIRDFFCLGLMLMGLQAPLAAQPVAHAPLLIYVVGTWIQMPIGKYLPGMGWRSAYTFYGTLQPQEHVTLFDLGGEVGDVRVAESHRPDPKEVPMAWDGPITSWTPSPGGDGYALGVQGPWPAPTVIPTQLPLDDSDSVRVMRDVLAKRGLTVDAPRITQAMRLPALPGRSGTMLFVTATSDEKALQDHVAGVRYTLIVLHREQARRITDDVLEGETSLKPDFRTIEEHNRLYGLPKTARLVAFVDVDGKGFPNVIASVTGDVTRQVDIFDWDGDHVPKKVLSVDKITDFY